MNAHKTAGHIEVIQGCMFAGKTEELIVRLRIARDGGLRVLAFKHAIDDRYDPDHLITHTRDRFDAVRVPDAATIERMAAEADVIGVDEGHFFGRPLIDSARRVAERGKRIIVVGLENDVWGRPLTPMPQLADLALHVVNKRVPCTVCGRPARFSMRMVPVTEPTMVGGVGDYEPRCAEHFEPVSDNPPPVA
jgi:thymidine kinase